ncbi:hypothetical protein [Aeromicrobium duanguangcaii]|uniref:Acetyltransferase n=1 Tax=Aeromicrobium duanguangcaii TaxID=2968086 RepID=A0ABY5KBV6_9ACTN|nr:hypothetical protein [Aeromicrobium duanguangcaii]MCD9154631.1 hypothetical protein [Aeromicrobium duanguangcaii]UUI67954.1 hypothetical protein NP095_12190 [Aeromicrobium duanguangcaii]
MLFASRADLPARMACYGASGTGAQVTLDLRHQSRGFVEFVGYVDDVQDPRRRAEDDYPVMDFEELCRLEDTGVFLSILNPSVRRTLHDKLRDRGVPILGARGADHLAHPAAQLGEGTVVVSTTRLGHTTRIGRGGLVWAQVVAHDVEIGDFVGLGVGSIVLGHVQIGDDVSVGAGAIIHNGTIEQPITIGDGAVIGPGAVVTHDVAPGEVMVGPRAMPLSRWRDLLGGRRESGRHQR